VFSMQSVHVRYNHYSQLSQPEPNNRTCKYKYMYSCTHNCAYRYALCSQVLYTVCCSSKLYAHKHFCKKNCKLFLIKQQLRLGTNVKVRGLNAGLLARSQFASESSCDRPTRSRFPLVSLGPRANAELVPKFHVAVHASRAALPMVTLKISL
jgi:hypothetical protein